MLKNKITIALYVVLLLGLSPFFTQCSDLSSFDEEIINKELADSLLGVTESQSVTVDIILDGYLRVRAESPKARTVEKDNDTYTRFIGPVVYVTVFDSTGHVETRVKSNELIYRSYNSLFEFEGDVLVETDGERTLRAEQLEWDEVSKQILSPGFVIITSPADSITGYGFQGDEDLIRYTLNRVTGQFTLN